MKKVFMGVLVVSVMLLSGSYAYSQSAQAESSATVPASAPAPAKKTLDTAEMSTTYGKTPFNKLTRGVLNMSTFYFEIPAGVMRVAKEKDNYFIGSTIGTAQGFFACMLRALTSVFDTATFLIPPYNKPIMEPEYTIQSLDQAAE